MSRISYFPVDYSFTTSLLYKSPASRNLLLVLSVKVTCLALATIAVVVETMQNALFTVGNTPIFILNKTGDLLFSPKQKPLPVPPKQQLINPLLITLLGEEQCRKLAELFHNPNLSLEEIKARLPDGLTPKTTSSVQSNVPPPPPLPSNVPPPPPAQSTTSKAPPPPPPLMDLFAAPAKHVGLPLRQPPVDSNPQRKKPNAAGSNPPPSRQLAPKGDLDSALKAAFKGRRASITGEPNPDWK